jgi:hypothetical protein
MAATSLSYLSGTTNGRVGIDTIKASLTALTPGAWYDVAINRPDGIGGVRVQADNAGAANVFLPLQTLGAYGFTVYPTNWPTGTVPQPGPPMASINTSGYNMAGVAVDIGMAFPSATVATSTLASANVSA